MKAFTEQICKLHIYWKCTVQICKSYISIESALYKYVEVTYLLKVHCKNISKLHIYWKYTVKIYQSYISIESTLYKYIKVTYLLKVHCINILKVQLKVSIIQHKRYLN